MSAGPVSPPDLPILAEVLNEAGEDLGRHGIELFELSTKRLLAEAREKTGLDDFGDPDALEALSVLVDAINEQGDLSPFGRYLMRRELLRLLQNRLQLEAVFKDHPEITERPIRRPILITGSPRAGTTILQELLACDPENRVALYWETQWPVPPPRKETYDSDPRIERYEREMSLIHRIVPALKQKHRMDALIPAEDEEILEHTFRAHNFRTFCRVQKFIDWNVRRDISPAYRYLKRFVQYLDWSIPAREQWVLKSPAHQHWLDVIFEVFPDACVIQAHRDPMEFLASNMSMIATRNSIRCRHVDYHELSRDCANMILHSLHLMVEFRKKHGTHDDQIFDLKFHEFVKDHIGKVEEIYRRFGRTLSREARARMEGYLAANPADKHGKHEYRFEDTGLDPDEIRRSLREYCEMFGL